MVAGGWKLHVEAVERRRNLWRAHSKAAQVLGAEGVTYALTPAARCVAIQILWRHRRLAEKKESWLAIRSNFGVEENLSTVETFRAAGDKPADDFGVTARSKCPSRLDLTIRARLGRAVRRADNLAYFSADMLSIDDVFRRRVDLPVMPSCALSSSRAGGE